MKFYVSQQRDTQTRTDPVTTFHVSCSNINTITSLENVDVHIMTYVYTCYTSKVSYLLMSLGHFFKYTADKWRVFLKGETQDYIHASFANIRKSGEHLLMHLFMKFFLFNVSSDFPGIGLLAKERYYHNSESNGEHCKRVCEGGSYMRRSVHGVVVML